MKSQYFVQSLHCSFERNKTKILIRMKKQYKRDTEQAAIAIKTARITGVSDRYVRMVINEDRENETVVNVYMALQEAEQEIENKLLKTVKEMHPFPSPNRLKTI